MTNNNNNNQNLNTLKASYINKHKYPEISYEQNYIKNNFEKIALFRKASNYKKLQGFESIFNWSNTPKTINTLEGKLLEMEINFNLPNEPGIFSSTRSEQIQYSKYFVKELICHLRQSINHYDTINPNFKKFLILRESKKLIFDPLVIFVGLKILKDFCLIFKERKWSFARRKILTILFCHLSMSTIVLLQRYFEFSAHYKFFEKEILKPKKGVSLEEEYNGFCKFKVELYEFELKKCERSGINHKIDFFEDDRNIKIREKEKDFNNRILF